jgi:hypothetical protein
MLWSSLDEESLEFLEDDEGMSDDEVRDAILGAESWDDAQYAVELVNKAAEYWENPTEFSLDRSVVR